MASAPDVVIVLTSPDPELWRPLVDHYHATFGDRVMFIATHPDFPVHV